MFLQNTGIQEFQTSSLEISSTLPFSKMNAFKEKSYTSMLLDFIYYPIYMTAHLRKVTLAINWQLAGILSYYQPT